MPSTHKPFSGKLAVETKAVLIMLFREENCTDKASESLYECMVKKMQTDESEAIQQGLERRRATVGSKLGLQVILDQHSNMESVATHFEADNSFKVHIGQPTEFPMLTRDPLTLSPGENKLITFQKSKYQL